MKKTFRLSSRELRRMQEKMMSSLGVNMDELGVAKEVTITLDNRTIRILGANIVALYTAAGKVYQIIGGEEASAQVAPETSSSEYVPSQEDISVVMVQAGVSEEQAKRALIECSGDLAKAILTLRSSGSKQ